jgi:hypothetical protein
MQLLSVLVLTSPMLLGLSEGQCWLVLGLLIPIKLLLTQTSVLHTLLLR